MVATYSINSPLNRQERTNLNDSLQDALSRLNSLQRQINTLSGGAEIEALLNEISETINNANTSIGDINVLIDRANQYLVAFEQAERDVNEAVTLANNATASANRAVQNLDGALQDTIDQANATINESLQTNTRTVDDLVVRTESELNGTIENANQTLQNITQNAEKLNSDLAGYNIPISDFNISTAYIVNQAVRFNGTTYRAKTATQNNPLPTNSQVENTWWTLEAQRGVDGDGAVSSVAGKLPSIDGNVNLTPQDISALGQEHLTDQVHRHVEVVNETPTDFTGRGILFKQVGSTNNAPNRPTYDEILENVEEFSHKIKNINMLKSVTSDEGTVLKVEVDSQIKGKYVIASSGFEDSYNVIRLNNGKFAIKTHENRNEWFKSFGVGHFAAHKGFNGYDETTQTNGVYPENSLKAFEKAGELGFKMIELDALVTSDGEWVVSHELDTKYLSGTLSNFNQITLENVKSRNLLRQYRGGSSYWNYSGDNSVYNIPTLEEALLVCKKYDMYAVIELKYIDPIYTEENYAKLGELIKKIGMEEKVIFLGSNSNTRRAIKYLPNSIHGYTSLDLNDPDRVAHMLSYKNSILLVSQTNVNTYKSFAKDNNIPLGAFTVDNYRTAESLFENGVDLILTNTLIKDFKSDEYVKYISYDTDSVLTNIQNAGVGTLNKDNSTGELTFSTNTFYSKNLTLRANTLKLGDIIKIKATGKTTATANSNVGKILIGNDKAVPNKREQTLSFSTKTYQTKEIYYVVNDVSEDIQVYVGFIASTGTAEAKFKDISIEVYSNISSFSADNERQAYIYAYAAPFALRAGHANKGIKSISVDASDTSTLKVEYAPFGKPNGKPVVIANTVYYSDNFRRIVLPVIDDTADNVVKLKFFERDGTPIPDVTSNMRMGFTILIKN